VSKRQKGKHKKRKRSWHRGPGETRKFQRAMRSWPQTKGQNNDKTEGG
jgi:hypothetical protein